MAHKKGGGSSRNGRDSNSKRLGVKRGDGSLVLAGTILVGSAAPRSCPAATSGWAGPQLYALASGLVAFDQKGSDRTRANVLALPMLDLAMEGRTSSDVDDSDPVRRRRPSRVAEAADAAVWTSRPRARRACLA